METDLEHQGLFSKFKNFNRRTRKYMTRIMQEHNVQQSEYPTNVYSIIFLFVIIRLPFQFRYYSYRTAGIIHYFLLFVARILPQKFSPLVGVNPECFSEIFRRFDDRCSLRIYPNKSYSFVEFSDIFKAIAAYNDLNGIRPFSERLPPTTMFFIIGGQCVAIIASLFVLSAGYAGLGSQQLERGLYTHLKLASDLLKTGNCNSQNQ